MQNREPPESEVAVVAAQGEVPREELLPHGWERLDRGSPTLASRACRAGSRGERHGCQRPRAEGKNGAGRGADVEGKLHGVAVAVQRRLAMGDGELPARVRGRSGQGRAGAREAHLRPGQQRKRPEFFLGAMGS